MLKLMSLGAALILTILATTAIAGPTGLSDGQYVAAARCEGLMASKALGKLDTAALEKMLKDEGGRRLPMVQDRADVARDDAARQASHAGEIGRAGLVAERGRQCQAFMVDAKPAMAGG